MQLVSTSVQTPDKRVAARFVGLLVAPLAVGYRRTSKERAEDAYPSSRHLALVRYSSSVFVLIAAFFPLPPQSQRPRYRLSLLTIGVRSARADERRRRRDGNEEVCKSRNMHTPPLLLLRRVHRHRYALPLSAQLKKGHYRLRSSQHPRAGKRTGAATIGKPDASGRG